MGRKSLGNVERPIRILSGGRYEEGVAVMSRVLVGDFGGDDGWKVLQYFDYSMIEPDR